MNLNFLCCIGAELKNSTQQTTRMTQVYLYRAFESETIADMLSTGFFNQALGIIRQDDLLLLYSPNEANPRWVYARVSSATRDGIEISKVDIQAQDISVDTTGYSNLSGNNLQEILNNLDTTITTINDTFVRKDGTSIMSAPLKFVAGSLRGAIGPSFGGVEFYTLNNDSPTYSLVALGRFTTSGLTPHSDNTLDIGTSVRSWKDAYIARVITGVINNGYDIAVPATTQPETLALKSEVDLAANSGRMITDEGVWFAKMYAASTVPTGAEYDGKNYADFSQVDSDNNPVIKIYTGASGAWTLTETITPPADYDGYVPITSKIWDIIDQTGQQGGRVLWNHQTKTFTPYPQIISFDNQQITNSSFSGGTITSSTFDGEATLSGVSTAPTPTASSPNNQIANKEYVAQIALPAGILAPFAGSSAPAGWLVCDGSAVSRTEYADLFAAIGTTFGPGDGISTFNLPASNERFVVEEQEPSADNNYTWYRLYNDGWVEQGGQDIKTATTAVSTQITLPVAMQTSSFTAVCSVFSSISNDTGEVAIIGQTTTSISLHVDSLSSTSGQKGFNWQVSGMAATAPIYNKIQCIRY